jgi:hypothetical protein
MVLQDAREAMSVASHRAHEHSYDPARNVSLRAALCKLQFECKWRLLDDAREVLRQLDVRGCRSARMPDNGALGRASGMDELIAAIAAAVFAFVTMTVFAADDATPAAASRETPDDTRPPARPHDTRGVAGVA